MPPRLQRRATAPAEAGLTCSWVDGFLRPGSAPPVRWAPLRRREKKAPGPTKAAAPGARGRLSGGGEFDDAVGRLGPLGEAERDARVVLVVAHLRSVGEAHGARHAQLRGRQRQEELRVGPVEDVDG